MIEGEPTHVDPGAPLADALADAVADVDPAEAAEAARRYQELLRSVQQECAALEEAGDESVQMSTGARGAIRRAVRKDVRRGAQVSMPATEEGPYSVSELALRTIVRCAVDTLPGVSILGTTFEFGARHGALAAETPVALTCRVSVALPAAAEAGGLVPLGDRVRVAVEDACLAELGLQVPTIDVLIEDLHA